MEIIAWREGVVKKDGQWRLSSGKRGLWSGDLRVGKGGEWRVDDVCYRAA